MIAFISRVEASLHNIVYCTVVEMSRKNFLNKSNLQNENYLPKRWDGELAGWSGIIFYKEKQFILGNCK